jgi:hypothetical protein
LEIVDRPDLATPPLARERITTTRWCRRRLPFAKLRACYRVCAATLYERLAVLANTSCVVKTDVGYRLADGTTRWRGTGTADRHHAP